MKLMIRMNIEVPDQSINVQKVLSPGGTCKVVSTASAWACSARTRLTNIWKYAAGKWSAQI